LKINYENATFRPNVLLQRSVLSGKELDEKKRKANIKPGLIRITGNA